jgi:hypothetical protein
MFRLWARRTDIRIWHLMAEGMIRSECGRALQYLRPHSGETWEQLRQDEPPAEGCVCRACLRLVRGDQRCQPRRKQWGRITKGI